MRAVKAGRRRRSPGVRTPMGVDSRQQAELLNDLRQAVARRATTGLPAQVDARCR